MIKPGQKVKVKSWNQLLETENNYTGSLKKIMKKQCGKIFTVQRVEPMYDKNRLFLKEISDLYLYENEVKPVGLELSMNDNLFEL